MEREPTDTATALVIEDNEHTSYLLSFMLERAGFHVDVVDNGRDAEQWIEDAPAAGIVLLDLMLPHVDGFQLLIRMRESPEWREVPIVVVSARTAEADVVRALDLGADDYVTKPFRPQELLARIRRLTRVFPGKVGS